MSEVETQGLRRVTIIGAGVSGLTVAHELVERGFEVQVVESEVAHDAAGEAGLAVGGLARSQYVRIPRRPGQGQLEAACAEGAAIRAADSLAWPRVTHLCFESGLAELTESGQRKLADLIGQLLGPLAAYRVEVVSEPLPEVAKRGLGERRVAHVALQLRAAGLGARVSTPAARGPMELRDAATFARASACPDGCGVEVRLDDAVVPGEHGFRFIPGCYRHLHDTLRRIRIYDERGATRETVDDRLVPITSQLLLLAGHPAVEMRRAPSAPFSAIYSWIGELGFAPRDAALYGLRLLRFATSCTARRAEYEHLSWWDFCTRADLGAARATDLEPPRLPYSSGFLEYLRHAPRALVAMDARHADARTHGNIYLQLLRDQLVPEDKVDAVFNAPTTEAWLRPWREHLVRLGVRFFSGRLTAIQPRAVGDHIRAEPSFEPTSPDGLAAFEPDSHYFVIATDLISAQRIARQVSDWGDESGEDVGVFRELQDFVLTEPPALGERAARRRDPETEVGLRPWDRLQTLTGVQYFSGQKTELSRGFGYFLDSSWALTSVTHTAHWFEPYSLSKQGCVSVVSVDVGDMRVVSEALGRTAWACERDVFAGEVWRQIEASVQGTDGARRLPQPLYYHVDASLEWGGGGVVRNRTPYLINVVDDWQRRPGPEPFDPWLPAAATPLDQSRVLWQAPHGGYCVHFGRFVFAGTYLRTHTRLTSMESANESGRHAVNAILDHVARERRSLPALGQKQPPGAAVASGVGDYCGVWPPERHEFAELDFLKALDAELLERRLPHFADILELDTLPDELEEPHADSMLVVLHHVGERLRAHLDAGVASQGDGMSRLLALLRQAFAL